MSIEHARAQQMQVAHGSRAGDVRIRRPRRRKGWGLRDRLALLFWRLTDR